jgi:hypothetical protein
MDVNPSVILSVFTDIIFPSVTTDGITEGPFRILKKESRSMT